MGNMSVLEELRAFQTMKVKVEPAAASRFLGFKA